MTMLNENIETKKEERKMMANQVKTNWFSLSGRATRREWWHSVFWGWGGFLTIVGLLFLMISQILMRSVNISSDISGDGDLLSHGLLCAIVSIVFFVGAGVYCFPVTVRRFHDCGKSGFWYLLYPVGLGLLGFIINGFLDGQPGTNQYGPDPKGR